MTMMKNSHPVSFRCDRDTYFKIIVLQYADSIGIEDAFLIAHKKTDEKYGII